MYLSRLGKNVCSIFITRVYVMSRGSVMWGERVTEGVGGRRRDEGRKERREGKKEGWVGVVMGGEGGKRMNEGLNE